MARKLGLWLYFFLPIVVMEATHLFFPNIFK